VQPTEYPAFKIEETAMKKLILAATMSLMCATSYARTWTSDKSVAINVSDNKKGALTIGFLKEFECQPTMIVSFAVGKHDHKDFPEDYTVIAHVDNNKTLWQTELKKTPKLPDYPEVLAYANGPIDLNFIKELAQGKRVALYNTQKQQLFSLSLNGSSTALKKAYDSCAQSNTPKPEFISTNPVVQL
jgi:hypothetical protein